MKRFYKDVQIEKNNDFYRVLLDGKTVKTTGEKHTLQTRYKAVIEAIAEEWKAQGDDISAETMPITQMLFTRLDRVSYNREAILESIRAFLDTDLLYFRAEEPKALQERQSKLWDNYYNWSIEEFGALPKQTVSFIADTVSPQTKQRFDSFLSSMSDDQLNAMALATQTLGSCLMAAHFMTQSAAERQESVEGYVDAYFCEEDFHVELLGIAHNGPDPMQDKKRKAMIKDLKDSAAYLALIEQG